MATPQKAHTEEQEEPTEIYEDDVLEVVADFSDAGEPMDEDGDEEMDDGGGADGPDMALTTFSAHARPVFAVSAHPTRPSICVSGGEDDCGYVWDSRSGEVLAKLTGHTDSVVAAEFSKDGEFLATGGMDGRVRIWKEREEGRRWEFITNLEGPDEVVWLRWHPKGPVLAAGGSDGTSWMWQVPSGRNMQVFAGHTGPVACGLFTTDGRYLLTASEDRSVIMWDPKSAEQVHKFALGEGRFSTSGSPAALAVNAAGSVAIVGGTEGGSVQVLNLVQGGIVGLLRGHEQTASVEALAFAEAGSGLPVLLSGGSDGRICFFDASSYRLRTTAQHEDAVTSLIVDSTRLQVSSGSADATCATWDVRTGGELKRHRGHRGAIHAIAITCDDGLLLSASEDGDSKVFPLQ